MTPSRSADLEGLLRIWEPSAFYCQSPPALQAPASEPRRYPNTTRQSPERPADPRLLIERGRLLATLGQAAKAAADFENAASLAPDDPAVFPRRRLVGGRALSSGLTARPGRSKKLRQRIRPQPAPPLGNTTIRWHEIAPQEGITSILKSLFKADDIVAYAMTVVYSTHPREAVLLIGSDDTARIWINGREVFLSKSFLAAGFAARSSSRCSPGETRSLRRFETSRAVTASASGSVDRLSTSLSPTAHAKKWKEAADAFSKHEWLSIRKTWIEKRSSSGRNRWPKPGGGKRRRGPSKRSPHSTREFRQATGSCQVLPRPRSQRSSGVPASL